MLDLRIASISIPPGPIYVALTQLDHEITRESGGKLQMPFVWHFGIRNGQISIQAHDLSLREVLDEMCRKGGLIYKQGAPGILPPGLHFDEPKTKSPLIIRVEESGGA